MFHATIKTADFRAMFQERDFSGASLEDERGALAVTIYDISDDPDFKSGKENRGALDADIISSGKITLPFDACDLLIDGEKDRGPTSQAETAEIFRDADKVYIYLDGARLYVFTDAEKDLDQELEKAQEEYRRRRAEEFEDADFPENGDFDAAYEARFPKVELVSRSTEKAEWDFAELFKGFSHIWENKTGDGVIEYGRLYAFSAKGFSVRYFGSMYLTTKQIGHWIKDWKTLKGLHTFEQAPNGEGFFDGVSRGCELWRPERLNTNAELKINALFPRTDDGEVLVYIHEAARLASMLKSEKAAGFFSVAHKEKHLPQYTAFNVGTVKKSLKYFTLEGETPLISVCERGGIYYLIVTNESGIRDGEFDIIPAKSNETEYCVLPLNFELNHVAAPAKKQAEKTQEKTTVETAKKAPTLDASTQAAKDAPKEETTEQTQAEEQETDKEEQTEKPEQEKRVKIAAVESTAPLATVPEPENRSAAADQNGPTAAAEPSRADEPSSRAEKPFEIGTYTTKKGKAKTAIKFNVTPRPEWIEALKTAFYWEYNGTWNGSPRKLPEIFKH